MRLIIVYSNGEIGEIERDDLKYKNIEHIYENFILSDGNRKVIHFETIEGTFAINCKHVQAMALKDESEG